MENQHYYTAAEEVYPGAYVPLLNEDEIRRDLKYFHHNNNDDLQVDVKDEPESFKVEIAVPGVSSENFLIDANENVLYVSVMHKEKNNEKEIFQMHEPHRKCFDCKILLPENTDTEFILAEYNGGILHLYAPKAKLPVENHHTRVVVY